MTLDTVWKAHWPGFENCCIDSNAHAMSLALAGTVWRCEGCGAWFEMDDSAAVSAFMGRASRLVRESGPDGGSPHPAESGVAF